MLFIGKLHFVKIKKKLEEGERIFIFKISTFLNEWI